MGKPQPSVTALTMNMIKNKVDFHRIRIINHDCSCTTLVVVNISEYSNSLRKCIASIVAQHCQITPNSAVTAENLLRLIIPRRPKHLKKQNHIIPFLWRRFYSQINPDFQLEELKTEVTKNPVSGLIGSTIGIIFGVILSISDQEEVQISSILIIIVSLTFLVAFIIQKSTNS